MKNKIIYLSFIGILLDQLVKEIIINKFSLFESVEIIKDFFQLTYVRNIGGAFGILEGSRFFFIIITILFLVYFIHTILKEKEEYFFKTLYYSMLLSGIIGNLIDRIIRGYVVDFFHFKIFSYDFPVFNLADIFIVIGIIFLFIDIVRSEWYECSKRRKRIKN